MNNSKGLSLIETAMVLALAAIVTAGVMFYYNSAAQNEKNTNAMLLMQEILVKVNSLYANQSSMTGLSNSVISKALPGIKTVTHDGKIYGLKVPGSDDGYISVMGGTTGKYINLIVYQTTTPAKSYYDTCMALTGGNFGTSFIGYLGVTSDKIITDQSVKTRHDFCKRKSTASTLTGRAISFEFQI
ncbi:hypothetical protein QUQ58_004904 [Escherichia coli]|nr:hypothetical protein [Escherichia coli]